MHQQKSVADVTPGLNDLFPRGVCRKAESAGNGVLSSGEKNFSVHKTYMNFLRPRKRVPEAALYTLRGSLLPENGTDATPFLSDVYNKGTCRKTESAGNGVLSSGEKNFSVHKTYMNFSRPRKRVPEAALYALRGRSMVEMLGVLAIIGVLSIGAIAGYQKAMFKYKLNKQAEQLHAFIGAVSLHQDDFKITTPGTLIPLLRKLNELPDNMFILNNDLEVRDIFDTRYKAYHHDTGYIGILSYINEKNFSVDICRNIYWNTKNFHDNVSYIQIIVNQTDGNTATLSRLYGDINCKGQRVCLKDMKITDTESLCRVCNEDDRCILYIMFNIID